jgi:hypothetical protein
LLRLAGDLRLLERRRYEHAARALTSPGILPGGGQRGRPMTSITVVRRRKGLPLFFGAKRRDWHQAAEPGCALTGPLFGVKQARYAHDEPFDL